jgi:hypothetical protein
MRVLVACEESGVVTAAFRAKGHDAWSCDLMPTSGAHPEWHLQGDVRDFLAGWDIIIGFPPCDHLAVSGARWFPQKRADGRQQAGIDLFMAIANAPCERIAIENPVGIMSTLWRKPDQIIQPYHYGHEAKKTTCLWLKGLAPLVPTNVVGEGEMRVYPDGSKYPLWISDANHKTRKVLRSRTFEGVAQAMADQWG